ncbi:MAG TPA: hypothetical protein VGN14_03320 [Candidatus Elarobacter sp.]|jgi:hypothetical protein
MTPPAPRFDIVPDTYDVALGDGWYPPERHRDAVFRWVEGSAHVYVASLRPVRHVLRAIVEPGPGVALKPFELAVEVDGSALGAVTVASKQTVTFTLPPITPRVFAVTLRAAGGGRPSPNDPRILDYRVFDLAVDHVADVFPAWAAPAKGFYPLERHDGAVFRWISGEATIDVVGPHDDALTFDAESGPGFGSRPFELRVSDEAGTLLAATEVASRTTVRVPLGPAARVSALKLSAEGSGRSVSGDPRTLNYRVFASR